MATQSFAQEFKLDLNKVKKYVEQHKNLQSVAPTMPQNQTMTMLLRQPMLDTAHYSHATDAGSVFILPQDNMPCLQPGKEEIVNNMPVATPGYPQRNAGAPEGWIPNVYGMKPLVLERKK